MISHRNFSKIPYSNKEQVKQVHPILNEDLFDSWKWKKENIAAGKFSLDISTLYAEMYEFMMANAFQWKNNRNTFCLVLLMKEKQDIVGTCSFGPTVIF